MVEFIKHYGTVYVTAFFCVMEILAKGMLSHTYIGYGALGSPAYENASYEV